MISHSKKIYIKLIESYYIVGFCYLSTERECWFYKTVLKINSIHFWGVWENNRKIPILHYQWCISIFFNFSRSCATVKILSTINVNIRVQSWSSINVCKCRKNFWMDFVNLQERLELEFIFCSKLQAVNECERKMGSSKDILRFWNFKMCCSDKFHHVWDLFSKLIPLTNVFDVYSISLSNCW